MDFLRSHFCDVGLKEDGKVHLRNQVQQARHFREHSINIDLAVRILAYPVEATVSLTSIGAASSPGCHYIPIPVRAC